MKIVVALDKFKGSIEAPRACEIVRDAVRSARPDSEIVVKPMADGGDGTARALIAARGGEWIDAQVVDPLLRKIRAGYGWFELDCAAVVEMAAASGITLLKKSELNPLKTTTYGTGQLIKAAVERGAKKIWLGVGGSATVDGGVGAAMALGWRFLDANGQGIGFGGSELGRIVHIEAPRDPSWPAIDVLCDVDNPLCGEHGAARVFGPQKGASSEMVKRLDDGLLHLAELIKEQTGRDILRIPGGGAAGGLAAGAVAFFDAKLAPGIETVMQASGLERQLKDADWAVTGEGRFDEQSLRGKVVSGVTKLARTHGVKVAVIAGSVQVDEAAFRREGIEIALSTMKAGMTLEHALANAEELLAQSARELADFL